MLWWLLPLLVLVFSLVVIGALAWRHLSDIAAIDVSSDPERRRRGVKNALYVKRLERFGGESALVVNRVAEKVGQSIKHGIKSLYGKALSLERHYSRLQKESTGGVSGSLEVRKQLLEESGHLMEREAYGAAEQRLIELLSLDPRNAEVYERLGYVYLALRQFDQAKETFQYAHQLSPSDASIIVSLGELELRDGHYAEAVAHFDAAVDVRPGNPKYLDFLVDTSILAGDLAHAKKGLKLLKESNPENKKIEAFEKRIAEMI